MSKNFKNKSCGSAKMTYKYACSVLGILITPPTPSTPPPPPPVKAFTAASRRSPTFLTMEAILAFLHAPCLFAQDVEPSTAVAVAPPWPVKVPSPQSAELGFSATKHGRPCGGRSHRARATAAIGLSHLGQGPAANLESGLRTQGMVPGRARRFEPENIAATSGAAASRPFLMWVNGKNNLYSSQTEQVSAAPQCSQPPPQPNFIEN
jgi:hypothetical protein